MAENNPQKVVTRFAPSPTGFLHIGGVRTALFAYLWARKNNGTFILRIEDTDKEREVAGSIAHIQESLTWLGITWDYGPDKKGPFGSCIQSERLEIYKKYAQKLVDKGLAYPDPYTKEELEVFRKQADAEKRPFLYRNHRPETFEKWDGTKPLRLKVSEIKKYTWHDEVRGDLEAGEEALDDFILIKSDGYPTYNFAHIIDDYEMGVTHIMRADEFISSTPRFLSLYDALEIPYPKFVTLPPILKDDRTKKLGKRDGAKDILEYRTEGYLSDAMRNFLALIGWNPGTEQEMFSHDELIEAFDIHKIQKAGGAFNETKLLWLNHEWIKKMPKETLHETVRKVISDFNPNFTLSDEVLEKITPTITERVQKWSDLTEMLTAGELDYVFSAPKFEKDKLKWKEETGFENTKAHLEKAVAEFDALTDADWQDTEKLKNSVWDYATEKGRGAVLWPLRFALTGKEKSPDTFVVASILGKKETLARLKTAISMCLLFFVLFFLAPNGANGATVEELQKNIAEKNKQIEDLNKEIEIIDKKIQDVSSVGQSLQSTIKVLDTSATKLNTEVKVTESKISKTDLSIEEIGLEIGAKKQKIERNLQTISKTLREINYSENDSTIESILSGNDLSAIWDNIAKMERFQTSVRNQVDELTGYKIELEKKKDETEVLKNDLQSLKNQLVDKKTIVDINKKEKTTLLTQTKNEEANYKKILAEKQKLADAFAKEIFDIESQIRIAVDPNSFPKAAKGILSWPVDNVRITQYYGLTEYSKRLYNSGSHNGIDFGAPIGTPVKAVAGGVVEEVGNTDAKASCAGRSYGKWVLIRHNNGLTSVFGHLSLVKAKNGDVVKAGDVVAYVGSSGYSTGPHLHLSLFASQGVNVGPLTSTTCGGMRIPLATPAAYLDPLPYF